MKYLQVPIEMDNKSIYLIDKAGRCYGERKLIAHELLTNTEARKLKIADKCQLTDFPKHSIYIVENHRYSRYDTIRNKRRDKFIRQVEE